MIRPHEVRRPLSGGVWAGGADGLYAIGPAGSEPTPGAVASLEGAAHLRYISSLLVDRQGRLWVGHDAGVTVYAPQPPMNGGASGGKTGPTLAGAQDTVPALSYTVADGLPHSMVRCLAEDSTGRIWAGTYRGAAVIEDGRIAVVDSAGGLMGDAVSVILADSSGGLWFGATEAPRGGLSLLADGSWQYFTTENGMPHNNINALMEDDDGAVWVATASDRGASPDPVADRGRRSGPRGRWEGHRHWVAGVGSHLGDARSQGAPLFKPRTAVCGWARSTTVSFGCLPVSSREGYRRRNSGGGYSPEQTVLRTTKSRSCCRMQMGTCGWGPLTASRGSRHPCWRE